jgi:hypothetical protein
VHQLGEQRQRADGDQDAEVGDQVPGLNLEFKFYL